MIEKLFIKNYLIIKEAEINFSSGLNILTGETGAGKSIILSAINLLLGNKFDIKQINNTFGLNRILHQTANSALCFFGEYRMW